MKTRAQRPANRVTVIRGSNEQRQLHREDGARGRVEFDKRRSVGAARNQWNDSGDRNVCPIKRRLHPLRHMLAVRLGLVANAPVSLTARNTRRCLIGMSCPRFRVIRSVVTTRSRREKLKRTDANGRVLNEQRERENEMQSGP